MYIKFKYALDIFDVACYYIKNTITHKSTQLKYKLSKKGGKDYGKRVYCTWTDHHRGRRP